MSDSENVVSATPKRLPTIFALASAIPLRRSIAVFGCTLFAGFAEAFGIALLLPLLYVLGNDPNSGNKLSSTVLKAFDALHLPHDPGLLVGLIALGLLLKGGLTLLALRAVGHAVAEVAANLRLELIDALMKAKWGYYVKQPVGRFANALGPEAERASGAYNAFSQVTAQSMQALVYIGIAFVASWQVAVMAIVVSLIMIGSLNRLMQQVRRNAEIQSARMRGMLSQLTDVLIGLKPMKAMARQAQFNRLFNKDLKAIKKASRKQVFARHTNRALQEPIMALFLALGIYVAITSFNVPIGTVVALGLLLAKTVSIVGRAQQELQNLYATQDGYWNVREAIDEVRAHAENTTGGVTPTFNQSIEFRDLNFAYGERKVLDHLNLTIKAGEIVALIGPSGAGKTTLVDLLLGLNTAQAGSILIDGVDLQEISLGRWRAMTGYVPQELTLFHDSVAANVTLGEQRFNEQDVEDAVRAAGAWDFVQGLAEGIQSVVGERGALLSGGQRQRIAVARALVHRPRLLILDEATSALDPATENMIVRNVCSMARDHGLTVLSISHHPAWVVAADRVLAIEHGRLVEQQRSAA